MSQTANPLKQYFRQPAIYVRLPSNGEFWDDGSLNLPVNKELPVLPMTAIDEITYRTPDSLFNGSAVTRVIQSCVPDIKDAWVAPGSDIPTLLVSIRIASYGHDMEMASTCPECNTSGEYTIDLRAVLEGITLGDYKTPLQHGDLEISFQPMNYRQQNDVNQQQFDQQRTIINVQNDPDLDDNEKIAQLNQALENITKLTVGALKYSVASIKTPSALVTETAHIEEFLHNCDRKLFTQVREKIVDLREKGEFRPIHVTCGNCNHEYDQMLNLDQTSFFAPAS
jgi:hypothetical protein